MLERLKRRWFACFLPLLVLVVGFNPVGKIEADDCSCSCPDVCSADCDCGEETCIIQPEPDPPRP